MASVSTVISAARRPSLASSSISGASALLEASPEGSFLIDESELSYYDFSVRDYDQYMTSTDSGNSSVVMNLDGKPTVTPKRGDGVMTSADKDPWLNDGSSSTTSGYNDTESSRESSTDSDFSSEEGEESFPGPSKSVCVLVQEVNSNQYY